VERLFGKENVGWAAVLDGYFCFAMSLHDLDKHDTIRT
jgi:hypothetical protein